jgi:predicted AlkP superfamily phosphohydrolase/phosphomutase
VLPSMKPKILIIGLDAATMDLVADWASAGHLPAIRSLMNQGTSCPFLSTPNMHSASAWTSILTGLNPGRHGLFVFSDRDFATGKVEFFTGGDRTGDLITTRLARYGLASGLLNVPMTYPAASADGSFVVSGLDGPDLNTNAFSPPNLRQELFSRFPAYNFTPPGLGDLMRAGRIKAATAAWISLIETQTSADEYLLDSHPVDFFMTVFTASDWGGHNLWQSKAGRHNDGSEEPPLLTIYRALDRAIARLLVCAGDTAQVHIISDHGMGPHTGASYHITDWLERSGYMVRKKGPAPSAGSMLNTVRKVARRALPVSIKERVKAGIGAGAVKRMQLAEKDSFYSSIDWGRTRAYSEPGRHVININLNGRNRDGIVPESEYDHVRNSLIRDLAEWTDPEGRKAVDHVVKREDSYYGPFAARASDLYVHWNPEAHFGEPPAEVKARGFWWSGDHRPHGILISKGPGVKASASIDPPIVYDLVPTVMYLAGLPIPDDLDGRVLEEICTEEFRDSNPIRRETPTASPGTGVAGPGTGQAPLSDSEEEVVAEKLRGLGYM